MQQTLPCARSYAKSPCVSLPFPAARRVSLQNSFFSLRLFTKSDTWPHLQCGAVFNREKHPVIQRESHRHAAVDGRILLGFMLRGAPLFRRQARNPSGADFSLLDFNDYEHFAELFRCVPRLLYCDSISGHCDTQIQNVTLASRLSRTA